MKITEMRELTPDELRHQDEETAKELFNLRMQKSTGQLEKPSRIRELRREMARLRTVQQERNREVPA